MSSRRYFTADHALSGCCLSQEIVVVHLTLIFQSFDIWLHDCNVLNLEALILTNDFAVVCFR